MKKAQQTLKDVLALYIEGSKVISKHFTPEENKRLTTSQKIEILEEKGIEV